MNNRSFKASVTSVLGSVIFHLLGIAVLLLMKAPSLVKTKSSVQVDLISSEELKKLQELEALQVVQMDKSINKETPEKAKFFSAEDQKVEKETVAQKFGQFQNVRNLGSSKKMAKKIDLKKLFTGVDPLDGWQKKNDTSSSQDVSDFSSEKTLESQTDDHISDVDAGLETLLNSREFMYYSYHNRIREKLAQYWQPKVREKLNKLFRQGRAPASTGQDRITKLMIVLDTRGTLQAVKVISDSGIQDLDDAAIEAFRAAAPFPHPPQGMTEKDGTIKIRWDFVLES